MRKSPELYLPAPYDSLMNQGDLYERYEQLQATPAAHFIDEMGPIEYAGTGVASIMYHEVFNPDMGTEADTGLLLLEPFAQGYTPSSHIRAKAILALLPEEERPRALVFL